MSLLNQIIELADQSTDMWDKVRLGKFTASTMFKLMSEPKSKEAKEAGELSEGAKTHVIEKVAEDKTGESIFFENMATRHGHEYEGTARALFSKMTGLEIGQTGFCSYGENAGGSPDGIFYRPPIGEKDGIIEIKCPFNSANHFEHILIESQEYFKANFKEYYWQMQANMLFTGTHKGWFISYDPRVEKDLQLFTILIQSDVKDQLLIDKKIEAAVKYKNEILNKINSKKQAA